MNKIIELINKRRVYFDGGMGSMLQKRGLKPGELPEIWSIEHPDIIEDIHRQYLVAGANVITTNTFGVNSLKHENYAELIKASIECVTKAKAGFEDAFVALDIGPLGRFLEPIGDLEFEAAVEIFAKNIRVANEVGVDLIIIETMTDSYETKAAVIAAKENSSLPVFVTNVYDENGKTLTGSTPESMISMLEGLSVDAIGMNCSLGPDKMIPLIERFYKASSTPIICNPNAGLPKIIDGKTSYSLDANEFADYVKILAEKGANILGGCCGTEPDYIKRVVEITKDIPLNAITKKEATLVSSYTHTLEINKTPALIGERINPTGKPKFKQALREGDMNYILNLGIKQADLGVHLLDVNVGLPEIDEETMLAKTVASLQSICDLPLQLDSNNAKALAKAMRIYNGKPLINSVNGDLESMDAIFPLVKKYGGVVIALTLDNSGIPETPQGRVDIAKRIIERAKAYGIPSHNIIFDPLAMTVATNPDNANITLETVKMLSELGYKTSLGISNVSFGMPNRDKINVPFFADALKNGLSCAIMNPNSLPMMTVYSKYIDYQSGVLSLDEFNAYIDDCISSDTNHPVLTAKDAHIANISLKEAIVKGLLSQTTELTISLLEAFEPLDIINNEIIPALNEVGESFDKQIIFLPQLLNSAECSSQAFSLIKEKMPQGESKGKSVILATVKGDIHDIGKNIVKLLIESYGFKVYDLGKDVSPEAILEAVKKHSCSFVALSALMTTTLPSMEKTIQLLHSYDESIKIMVGGAVLTEEYSKQIGADFYGKDAISAAKIVEEYYK